MSNVEASGISVMVRVTIRVRSVPRRFHTELEYTEAYRIAAAQEYRRQTRSTRQPSSQRSGLQVTECFRD